MRTRYLPSLASSLLAWMAGGLILLSLLGCGHRASPVLGAWQGNMGALGQFTVTFKPDGTLSQTSNNGMVLITGTYSTNGDTLTSSEDSASVMGKSVPLTSASTMPGTCKFAINGDTMTLSYGSNNATLTRVK